jgi:hypothetical protein
MGSTVPVAVIAPLTNYLIVKKHFKSLSRINTASVPIVLNIDTPTQMLPSLVGEKYKVFGPGTPSYVVRKITYGNAIFSVNLFLRLLQPVLFYTALGSTAFCPVHFLSKKDPVERSFSTDLKIVN